MAMGDTAEVVAKRYRSAARPRMNTRSPASSGQRAPSRADSSRTSSRRCRCAAPCSTRRPVQAIGEETVTVDRDECNRPDTTLDGLLKLPPAFDTTSGHGQRHRRQLVAALRRRLGHARHVERPCPGARHRAAAGVSRLRRRRLRARRDGHRPGVRRAEAAEANTDFASTDIDVWELNEAFASQVIYCRDRLGIPMDRLNLNGGSIAIGHPFGMTGSRLVGTIANEMQAPQGPLRRGHDVRGRRSGRGGALRALP